MSTTITIDGPAGSGKTTAARLLAGRLGYDFLDTGAMYRAVALGCLRAQIDPADASAVAATAAALSIELQESQVRLDGCDVTEEVRSSEVTEVASRVATVPAVREILVERQRQWAGHRNVVTEGRDQGTIVFPDALCKFFLTACPDERAARRLRELEASGQSVSLEEMRTLIRERDERDATRSVGPLRPADDAETIDTTGLTMDEVVDRLEQRVQHLTRQQA